MCGTSEGSAALILQPQTAKMRDRSRFERLRLSSDLSHVSRGRLGEERPPRAGNEVRWPTCALAEPRIGTDAFQDTHRCVRSRAEYAGARSRSRTVQEPRETQPKLFQSSSMVCQRVRGSAVRNWRDLPPASTPLLRPAAPVDVCDAATAGQRRVIPCARAPSRTRPTRIALARSRPRIRGERAAPWPASATRTARTEAAAACRCSGRTSRACVVALASGREPDACSGFP